MYLIILFAHSLIHTVHNIALFLYTPLIIIPAPFHTCESTKPSMSSLFTKVLILTLNKQRTHTALCQATPRAVQFLNTIINVVCQFPPNVNSACISSPPIGQPKKIRSRSDSKKRRLYRTQSPKATILYLFSTTQRHFVAYSSEQQSCPTLIFS